jgi:hypothetical protein
MITDLISPNIEGEWSGAWIYSEENTLMLPVPINLSFISPSGQGRFIGEIENCATNMTALVCGKQLGNTVRFEGSFRADHDNETYAEFAGHISDDSLALRGSFRLQLGDQTEGYKLISGTWHASKTDKSMSEKIAEVASQFAQKKPVTAA